MRDLPLTLLTAAVASGCLADSPAPYPIVRDSAGIRIVESRAPREGPTWQVGPDPRVRVGSVDGAPHDQLSGVAGAVRLSSGALAVADGGSSEVRFYDPEGAFLRAFGGPGAGPGEFTTLAGMGPAPDGGVWAYDFALRRITWLSEEGGLDRVTSLGPEPPGLTAVGPLRGAGFVPRQLWGVSATAEAGEEGLRREDVAFVLFDDEGRLLDTIALAPGRELHLHQEGGRGVMTTPPFGRDVVAAPTREAIVVGTQDRRVLREYGPDGALRRRIFLPDGDLALDQAQARDWIETRVGAVPASEQPGLRAALSDLPLPEQRPAHGALLSDEAGRLWLADWAPPGDTPTRWAVLDPDGVWLAEVETPDRFTPTQIGLDWMLGVERDELDVEYVALYSIHR